LTVRRVFLIWVNPLFHESARLLLKHPDILWLGETANIATAREQIERLHPDTILFEKTGASIPAEMIEIQEEEKWDMRVIGVSLDKNELSLYHHEHRAIVEAGDLLQLVLG
jgi:nucleotide-binding universal stress UspA family protein